MISTAFRLTRRDYADLSGRGGLMSDGRWHSAGREVTYAADTPALAVLEVLVHFDLTASLFYDDFVMMTLRWPPTVRQRTIEVPDLPEGWATRDGERFCRAMGDAWLSSGETALLFVPSAVMPLETNVLLNPRHPDSSEIEIVDIVGFSLDPRLLGRA